MILTSTLRKVSGKEDADDTEFSKTHLEIFWLPGRYRKIHNLPELPGQKFDKFINEYELPRDDADLLIKYKKVAEYFEAAARDITNKKLVSNYILGQIYRRMPTDADKEECRIPIPPSYLNELISLLESKKITSSMASKALELMLDTGRRVGDFISEKDMEGIDEDRLRDICIRAVNENRQAVISYLEGKEKALKSIVGYVMKETRGKADGLLATEMIKDIIHNLEK